MRTIGHQEKKKNPPFLFCLYLLVPLETKNNKQENLPPKPQIIVKTPQQNTKTIPHSPIYTGYISLKAGLLFTFHILAP